jgi:ABC-type molybdate transport system substrate-binding protein
VSDDTRFMDWLDIECSVEANPNGNDKIVSATRHDFVTGPGNEKYAQEEIPEGEVYITTYTVAVCRSTGLSYESEMFVNFMLSEAAREAYEAYGFEMIEQ